MALDLLLYVYVACVGLVVGSYLNVVVHRLPRGVSTVLPRSRCPRCNALLRARDNVPLISFLLLRGRCRYCGEPIAWRYPLIEALTALLFVLSYVRFGATLEAVVAAAFCAAMLALAAIDVEHYLLPDVITLPGIALGLLLQPWVRTVTLRDALLGVALGGGTLLAVALLWYLVRRVHAMGMGDVKMLAMIGAFLGWQGVLVTLFLGSLTGSAVGLGLIVARRLDLQSKLPFGAFLALGAVVTLFLEAPLRWAWRGVWPP